MSDDQGQLDWGDAAEGREDGMARAEEHAPTGWNDRAYDVLGAYAAAHEFFHCDEFWTWAIPQGLTVPPNGRALGPVILRAAKAGVLLKTEAAAPSVRSHLSLKPVWRCPRFTGERTGRFRNRDVA